MQHALQHIRHLFFRGLPVAGDGHLYFQRGIFSNRNITAQRSRHRYSLSTSELQHRLHVFPEKRSFNRQFIGQVTFDNTKHPFVDMTKFEVMIAELPQIDDPHSDHLGSCPANTEHSVSHDRSTGINAQNNLFFYRLNHSNTSINVGNPTTLSLNIFTSSWLSRAP